MSGSGLFPDVLDLYAGRASRVTGLQAPAMASLTPGAPSFGWIGVSVHHSVFIDVGLWLLCNVIFRPLLFAAAFFMWVYFLGKTSCFLQHRRKRSPARFARSNL
jgi:hypothetical protein